MDALAQEMAGQLKVVKVNVADDPDVAGRFGIMQILALLVFKGGQVVETVFGSQTMQAIAAKVQPHL